MERWEHACIHCSEIITNPVCGACLSKQIEQWLLEKSEELVEQMRQKTKALDLDGQGQRCVVCGGDMTLCPYCYIEYVYFWLRDEHPWLIAEFIDFFNFDLGHRGYQQDAEARALC